MSRLFQRRGINRAAAYTARCYHDSGVHDALLPRQRRTWRAVTTTAAYTARFHCGRQTIIRGRPARLIVSGAAACSGRQRELPTNLTRGKARWRQRRRHGFLGGGKSSAVWPTYPPNQKRQRIWATVLESGGRHLLTFALPGRVPPPRFRRPWLVGTMDWSARSNIDRWRRNWHQYSTYYLVLHHVITQTYKATPGWTDRLTATRKSPLHCTVGIHPTLARGK